MFLNENMYNFDILLLIAAISSTYGVDIVEVPFQPRVKGRICRVEA